MGRWARACPAPIAQAHLGAAGSLGDRYGASPRLPRMVDHRDRDWWPEAAATHSSKSNSG